MKNSKIEWTHHTFSPWWGCFKVSPGCHHCYADTFSTRLGLDIWGPLQTTDRRLFGEKHWAEPLRWNAAAAKAGERHRVFCASMADVFEDHPQLDPERAKLWPLIAQTPHLDWLLLSKRPENMVRMAPAAWAHGWPANVWAMTSIEDQQRARERLLWLLEVPAVVLGLSCEPLLSAIDLTRVEMHAADDPHEPGVYLNALTGHLAGPDDMLPRRISWVIVGGESGPKARPMHVDWARSLRDQCTAAGVSFHFKQWGEHVPVVGRNLAEMNPKATIGVYGDGRRVHPQDRINDPANPVSIMVRVGKKSAGRLLDGREWNEFPEVRQ